MTMKKKTTAVQGATPSCTVHLLHMPKAKGAAHIQSEWANVAYWSHWAPQGRKPAILVLQFTYGGTITITLPKGHTNIWARMATTTEAGQ